MFIRNLSIGNSYLFQLSRRLHSCRPFIHGTKLLAYQILALLFKSTTLIPHLFHIYHEEYEYLECYRLKTWMEFGKKEVSGVNCALKNYRIHSEFNILGQAFRSDR